jgi:hypothetical protein
MRFDELPLYQAVYRGYQVTEKPGAEHWITTRAKEVYKLVLMDLVDQEAWTEEGIPYSLECVIEVWRSIRKSPDRKIERTCEVSLTHGSRCFYSNRGLGECSGDVHLDRLIPGSRGGEYNVRNCVIACSFHNQARGDQSIEDFLRPGQVTSPASPSDASPLP